MIRRAPTYTQRAVVLGAGINALGVVRSLASRGVPVVVVAHASRAPAMQTRFGRKVRLRDSDPETVLAGLSELAAERPAERSVLLATEEETVSSLVHHYDWLGARFHLTMAPPAALTALLNKAGIESVAHDAGLYMPKTRRFQNKADLSELSALRPPLVIKPAVRDSGYARKFKKAYRVECRSDAETILTRALSVLPDMIVQEWIDGDDSALYFCLQYLPGEGRSAYSFVGRKLRSWPPAVGGTASAAPAPEASELAEATTRFFTAAGVTGLAGLEYKYDAVRGAYAIIEPTVGRTDFQEEVATLNGVNLPLIAYCDQLGLPMPADPAPERPTIWRERSADRQAMQAIGRRTAIPAGSRAALALWRTTDPVPALAPLAIRLRRRLRRLYPPRHPDIT